MVDVYEAANARTADAISATPTPLTTPAGIQANATLSKRRWLVLILNVTTWFGLLAWAATILGTGGWSWLDAVLYGCFMLGTPWSVLGFWNAMIGLFQLHAARDGISNVAPYIATGDVQAPLGVKTAVLMTVRNEAPERAIRRLKIVKDSLDATGEGPQFSYFLLSDTDIAAVAEAEAISVATWRATDPDGARIFYRRRDTNTGFKAGNVRDFCQRWGSDFELMLPLDADSLMLGNDIVKLVRIMQAYPKIGILQSLVVGTPSSSAFARVFQFGMRLGMRAYTMGQAWWVGDCGPFWGHNAVVRIKPFVEHCALPILPGSPPLGGHVLSHDQVEATLMRRAGFEVRVMPVEGGSYEDNPPDALEFIRRDVRWCQGNMQYLKLVDYPGLLPVSRFQLVWAILMFAGIPAWTLMIAALPFAAAEAQAIPDFPVASAQALYLTFLLMYLSPKIAGAVDAVLTPGEVRRFGGAWRFALSCSVEVVFAFLQGAVTTIRTSLFMVGLIFGKSIVWSGQQRDARGLSWSEATSALWPQLIFGLWICSALLLISPATLIWSLPLTAGYILAIPFAVITADRQLGQCMQRHGLVGIPEDFAPPRELVAMSGNAQLPLTER